MSTTVGVNAPGRWMLATARRSTVERGRGMRAANSISRPATRRSITNTASAAPMKMAAILRS